MCARIGTSTDRWDVDVECRNIKWKASGRFEVAYPTPISRHQIYNPRTYIDSWNLFYACIVQPLPITSILWTIDTQTLHFL
jgi:hypothetical protein